MTEDDPELNERWVEYWRNSDPSLDLQQRFDAFWELEANKKTD